MCWRVALTFSVPAAAGAYAGTVANGAVSAQGLVLAFVPVMITAALLTYRRGDDPGSAEVLDRCSEPEHRPSHWRRGVVVGSMTGFLGVGGGFLIVPALTLLLGLGMRRAIATSLAIITLTGAVALISHLARGAQPDWPLTVVLASSAGVGALGGSALGCRLPAERLAQAFAVVVAVVAIFLLVDVLALGGPPVG